MWQPAHVKREEQGMAVQESAGSENWPRYFSFEFWPLNCSETKIGGRLRSSCVLNVQPSVSCLEQWLTPRTSFHSILSPDRVCFLIRCLDPSSVLLPQGSDMFLKHGYYCDYNFGQPPKSFLPSVSVLVWFGLILQWNCINIEF